MANNRIKRIPRLLLSMEKIARQITFPGLNGIAIYDILRFFFKGIRKGAITTRASSLAFHFFLAIFPSIIFIFTLIPYVPIHNFQNQLLNLIQHFLPQTAYKAAESTILDIIKHQRGGLLSFGCIGALYFATNGVNAMINAFNKSYHTVETRSIVMQWLVAVLLLIIQAVIIISAIVLIIMTTIIIHKVKLLGTASIYMIQGGRWIIVFALFFFMISFTYYLGPAKKSGWKFFSVGAFFSTLFCIITSLGFAYYVNHFGRYNKLYGSIGTLVVILLWIYFNAIILLLGFELNASINNAKRGKINLEIDEANKI